MSVMVKLPGGPPLRTALSTGSMPYSWGKNVKLE